MSTLVIGDLSDGTNTTSSLNIMKGVASAYASFSSLSTSSPIGYNVSSITFNAYGNVTVNFTTPLKSKDYIVGSCSNTDNVSGSDANLIVSIGPGDTQLTTSCNLRTGGGYRPGVLIGAQDGCYIVTAVFIDNA